MSCVESIRATEGKGYLGWQSYPVGRVLYVPDPGTEWVVHCKLEEYGTGRPDSPSLWAPVRALFFIASGVPRTARLPNEGDRVMEPSANYQTNYQKATAYNPRSDFIVEGIQMVSGILLVLFLWTHMIFVSAIWLGVGVFNTLAHFMEAYKLLPITIVLLILIIGAHVGAVIRRIPRVWSEQKVVWQHAKLIRHADTWSWLFQAVTGGALLALAIVHIAVVTYGGINANLSSLRVRDGFLIFYAVLLLLSEYHASVGLYRIFVKWGWMRRHSLKRVLEVVTVLTVTIGAVTLGIFYVLGAHAA